MRKLVALLALALAFAAPAYAQVINPTTGNVQGPASSTDNDITLFSGTTGKLLKGEGATITLSAPAAVRQTWNAGGVTFTGFKVNVTDTASAAASTLADFQVAGVSQFSIRKDGNIFFSGGSGTFTLSSSGLGLSSGGFVSFGTRAYIDSPADGQLRINNNAGTQIAILAVDGASNILALRNGLLAQNERVYNSFTDAANGSWATINFTDSANVLTIGTKSNGSGIGVPTKIQFVVEGVNKLDYGVSNASGLTATTAFYATGNITTSQNLQFQGSGYIIPSSDGVWSFRDNATTSFGRLQFGGTTSSFPALARNAAILEVKLADASAFATISANTLRSQGFVVASLPAGVAGDRAYVTDQLTACPVLSGTFTGGGAVKCSAFYNGTAWVHE